MSKEKVEALQGDLNAHRLRLVDLHAEVANLQEEYDEACRRAINDEAAAAKALLLKQQIEIAGPKIRGLELAIAELESHHRVATNEMEWSLQIERREREERERLERWKVVRAACIAARQKYKEKNFELGRAIKEAEIEQSHVEGAQKRLQQALQDRFTADDFASDRELAEEQRRLEVLEEALRLAVADAAKVPNRMLLALEVAQARDEFHRLRFVEHNLRPGPKRSTKAFMSEVYR